MRRINLEYPVDLIGPQQAIALQVELPVPDMGNALRLDQAGGALLRGSLGGLERSNVDTIADDVAAWRAELDDHHPATVIEMLLKWRTVRRLMQTHPLPDPFIDPAHGGNILPALRPAANNLLEGRPLDNQVAAGVVDAAIGLVADDKPILLIVDDETDGHVIHCFI